MDTPRKVGRSKAAKAHRQSRSFKFLKLAKLTPEQDSRWGQLMGIALGQGLSDAKAAEDAWLGLCEEWPELAQYDGAE